MQTCIILTARSSSDNTSLLDQTPHLLEGCRGSLRRKQLQCGHGIYHVDIWEGRLVDLHLFPHVHQTPLLDGILNLLAQGFAVDCLMGVDHIVALAVLAPIELIGRGDFVPGREL